MEHCFLCAALSAHLGVCFCSKPPHACFCSVLRLWEGAAAMDPNSYGGAIQARET